MEVRGINVEGQSGIVRHVNLVVDGHAGILHDQIQHLRVFLVALLDGVALGQYAADAANNQIMPPTIKRGMHTMYSSKRTRTMLP